MELEAKNRADLLEDLMPTMTESLGGTKNVIRATLVALERIS